MEEGESLKIYKLIDKLSQQNPAEELRLFSDFKDNKIYRILLSLKSGKYLSSSVGSTVSSLMGKIPWKFQRSLHSAVDKLPMHT